MLFICYPRCSTCIKARNYLISNKVNFVERDIKINNPTKEELTSWVNKYQIDIKKLFNTSGLLYKEYDLKNKLPNMKDSEKIELLASNGMLVKRPILITEETILLGFKEPDYANIINKGE